MRPLSSGILVASLAVLLPLATYGMEAPGRPQRKVALTIDDLPLVSVPGEQRCDPEASRSIVRKFLKALEAHGIPATGFVVEGRYCDPEDKGLLTALLEQWVDGGVDLGNHTYSHLDLNVTPLARYEDDIVRGERITRGVLEKRGKRLRWFRHPMLHTGADPETKAAVERFIRDRGYRIAPVTLDNQEYVFAMAYRRALEREDLEAASRIVRGYLAHMEEVYAYYERLSRDLLGREIPQVLLIHANALNADHLPDLVHALKTRGYAFVSLDEALVDPAYGTRDVYVGKRGISWLQRWAQGSGLPVPPEPREPDWVREMAAGSAPQ